MAAHSARITLLRAESGCGHPSPIRSETAKLLEIEKLSTTPWPREQLVAAIGRHTEEMSGGRGLISSSRPRRPSGVVPLAGIRALQEFRWACIEFLPRPRIVGIRLSALQRAVSSSNRPMPGGRAIGEEHESESGKASQSESRYNEHPPPEPGCDGLREVVCGTFWKASGKMRWTR